MKSRIHLLSAITLVLSLFFAHDAFCKTVLSPLKGTNNQVQINLALKKGGVVHLNAGTYIIDSNIEMVDGSTLEGDRGAKVVVKSDARWKKYRPVIRFLHVNNARVAGFEIDANRDNNLYPYGSAAEARGHRYYRIFYLYKSKGVEIDHMYLHDTWDDVLFAEKAENVNFHDNIVRRPGRDIVSAYKTTNTYVMNNCMRGFNDAVLAWANSTPVYAISNDVGKETDAESTSAFVAMTNSKINNCNNTLHNLNPPTLTMSNGQVIDGGCPVSISMSLAASSCNVADLESADATNTGGTTTTTETGADTTTTTGTDNTPGADTSDSDSNFNSHFIGGFRAKTSQEMAALAAVGGNVVMNYNSVSGGLDGKHDRLISDIEKASALGLKMVDDIPHQIIKQFHADWDLDKAVSTMTTHMKWMAANEKVRSQVVGYWMIDDWDTDFGKAKVALQKLTGLIHKYTPGKYAICGVQGNSPYGSDVAKYQARFTLNYSPEGCDMIGIYMYPYGERKSPMTNLVNILKAFRNVGWDNNTTPLVGISQSYGGLYGYYVPTAAQVEAETKYFCQLGARHIMWFDFDMGSGNAGNSTAIQSGIKAGIKACKAIWGN